MEDSFVEDQKQVAGKKKKQSKKKITDKNFLAMFDLPQRVTEVLNIKKNEMKEMDNKREEIIEGEDGFDQSKFDQLENDILFLNKLKKTLKRNKDYKNIFLKLTEKFDGMQALVPPFINDQFFDQLEIRINEIGKVRRKSIEENPNLQAELEDLRNSIHLLKDYGRQIKKYKKKKYKEYAAKVAEDIQVTEEMAKRLFQPLSITNVLERIETEQRQLINQSSRQLKISTEKCPSEFQEIKLKTREEAKVIIKTRSESNMSTDAEYKSKFPPNAWDQDELMRSNLRKESKKMSQ